MDNTFPTARKSGLVVQEMPDELLVYDTENNKAHCLNTTAAFVWKSCDGKKTARAVHAGSESHDGGGAHVRADDRNCQALLAASREHEKRWVEAHHRE